MTYLLSKYLKSVAAALALGCAFSGETVFSDVHFPADASLPYKFGVFIGINKYPHLREQEQLDGCVHDAQTLQRLFADSFDVKRSVLLTDEQATRRGIGQALAELVQQVKVARARTKGPIDVVIEYSGHGTRVARLPSENDPNSLDNAWVASDSTRQFDQVVRGHELLLVHTALAKLNAQVLIISDSCHSDNGYRGVDFAKARCVLDGEKNAPGPSDDLFPDLQKDFAASGSTFQFSDQSMPGFVYYAACRDDEEAREYHNPATDQHFGRLSYVLANLLRRHDPELTYDELAGEITVQFAALQWDGVQHPQFHAAPGKGGDLFLHAGQRPPLNARILKTNQANGTLELSLGSLDGVTFDSRFCFYGSMDDLVNHRSSIGQARVTDVTPITCTVKPENSASIPAGARAMMDEVRMTDFVVGLDGDVPQPIQDKLQQMDANKQIQLARAGAPYTIAVHYDAKRNAIGCYLPSALPGGEHQPAPLREAHYANTSDAENVADNLLYVARVQRLMTLKPEGADPLFAANIISLSPLSPATRPADGLPHLREGSRLVIKLTNKQHETPLYFWVFAVGADDSLTTLYPTGGGTESVPPGQTLEIGRERSMTASVDGPNVPSGSAELTTLKVIASANYVDLQSLANAPSTNMETLKGTRGLGDPLFNLLMEAAHGGGGTRGIFDNPPNTVWDTADVAVDVIKN